MESYEDDINEIIGFNLDNYVPYQRNCDTVLYVHKRVLEEENAEYELNVKKIKAEKKNKEKIEARNARVKNNESVLEQTVRFAKNIAPIVIPQNDENTPVFYTVEACSKCKKREKTKSEEKRPREIPSGNTYQKQRCKKIIETFRKDEMFKHERKNTSNSESVSHTSQSNTLDDLNINQSLSCTMSEQSEKRDKIVKNEVNTKRKKRKNKCVISESFEAIAEDLSQADETRIKIQMMNPAEKNAFCDSIKAPVINAIKDCILEFEDNETKEEVKTMKRMVKNNMNKIDIILEKLMNIEQHLNKKVLAQSQPEKVSILDQLSADIEVEEKSFEEEFEGDNRCKENEDKKVENMGCGEVVNVRPSTSVGVKTEKPNTRLPARFCWTNAKNI